MLIRGDARALPLADGCVDCCITSPPYWGLRDYGHKDQIGLQRGHSRRHAGFNDRWDAMHKNVEQMGGANKRSVWTVATHPYAGAHFATFPEKLIEPCILAGCPVSGLALDPFVGSGTVVGVAERRGRRGVGVDLSYQDLAKERTAQRGLRFTVND